MVQNSSLVKSAHENESLPRSHAESPLAFSRPGSEQESGDTKDYMVEVDGTLYAGTHVLADLWQATGLDDIELIEQSLREAIDTCGATLLHIHLHEFTPNGGVSGVAVLAESHISVHTWPEHGFAAFDIFMCGDCDPRLSVPVLERYFQPEHVETNIQMRGRVG